MLMSRALNTIIHQIRHEKLVSSMRKEQYETHTATPNTLLHDNSNCRYVCHNYHWVPNGINILRCNRCIASFPGRMGMSPRVTWSGPISYSLNIQTIAHISGIHTASIHHICWHVWLPLPLWRYFLLTHYPNKLSTSPSLQLLKRRVAAMFILIVSLSWMTSCKQKCNHRRKTLHIW